MAVLLLGSKLAEFNRREEKITFSKTHRGGVAAWTRLVLPPSACVVADIPLRRRRQENDNPAGI